MCVLSRRRYAGKLAVAGAACIGILGALASGSMAQQPLKATVFIGPAPLYIRFKWLKAKAT